MKAVKLAGKKVFEKPTEHLLDAMQKTGSKVYLYSFAWQSFKRRRDVARILRR